MAVLLVFSLPALFAAWFFWRGWGHDPALAAATELVRRDGIAHQVLGEDIHVTGIESRNFAYAWGLFSENAYTVDLEGSSGSGTLDIRSHTGRSGVKIDTLRLTGPDGRRYDLMTHAILPSAPGTIDNSI
jgi:hypothetical protein